MSALRFMIQMLRSFDGKETSSGERAESALDMFISNPNFKTVVYVAAYNSKVPFIQAAAL